MWKVKGVDAELLFRGLGWLKKYCGVGSLVTKGLEGEVQGYNSVGIFLIDANGAENVRKVAGYIIGAKQQVNVLLTCNQRCNNEASLVTKVWAWWAHVSWMTFQELSACVMYDRLCCTLLFLKGYPRPVRRSQCVLRAPASEVERNKFKTKNFLWALKISSVLCITFKHIEISPSQAYLSLLKREPQPMAASFEQYNTTNIFFLSYAGVSFSFNLVCILFDVLNLYVYNDYILLLCSFVNKTCKNYNYTVIRTLMEFKLKNRFGLTVEN